MKIEAEDKISQFDGQKDFDSLLIQAFYDTIAYCLGETNAGIICKHLEKRNLPLTDISKNPELFSDELRNIIGGDRGQILGAATILEETTLELLCKNLGTKLEATRPVNFPVEVRKLKKQYSNGGT